MGRSLIPNQHSDAVPQKEADILMGEENKNEAEDNKNSLGTRVQCGKLSTR